MTSKWLRLAILFVNSLTHTACSAEQTDKASPSTAQASASPVPRGTQQTEGTMQIAIRAGERTLTARLEDSAAAREFAALLPIELTLEDYASTEKIAELPRRLSTTGAPAGFEPVVGDLAYYAPWGNLALYYRDFGYSRGLVRLGRIEAGAETLGSLEGQVTIEAVETPSR